MRTWALGMAGLLVVAAAGCRSRTRIAEIPRVDLELTEGNRGYLVGAPPEGTASRTTREMVEATIELPALGGGKHPSGTGESLEAGEPFDGAWAPDAVTEPSASPAPAVAVDIYVVQKGESLWSIAAKPEVYGKATRWRDLFDANRDVLKSPNDIQAGMRLKIPRSAETGSTTYNDDGITVKK